MTPFATARMSLENHLDSCASASPPAPPVHRLDRDTSGCLLLARNPKAHRRFAAAFEAGRGREALFAVVSPPPQAASGLIDLPLAQGLDARGRLADLPDAEGQAGADAMGAAGGAGR